MESLSISSYQQSESEGIFLEDQIEEIVKDHISKTSSNYEYKSTNIKETLNIPEPSDPAKKPITQ